MSNILLAFLAIYFIAVGAAGNGEKLWQEGLDEMPGYLPWAAIIFGLGFLATSPYTEKLGKPVVILLVLAYALKNYGEIETGMKAGYNALQKAFGSYAAPTVSEAPLINSSTDQSNAQQDQTGTQQSTIADYANIAKNGGIL